MDAVQFSIPFLTNLRSLNLSRSRFGDRMVPDLAALLLSAPNVTELNLTNVALTGHGLKGLAEEFLAKNPPNLVSLDLTSNKFNEIDQAYQFG